MHIGFLMIELLSPIISDLPVVLRVVVIALLVAIGFMLRYGTITGLGFGLSQLVGKFAPQRRLQPQPFTKAQISREIFDSMISVLMFTLVVGVIVLLNRAGLTKLYDDPYAYGELWFWMQIPAALLIQDFYFYWMHRIIHTPSLYKRIHRTHHLSINPSAFAAFAFHPLEAVLAAAIFILIVMVLPMTLYALILVSLLSLIYNVYGHLGYEVMPRFLGKSPLGYLLNTSTYHNQHHRSPRCNYGLYTVIWDRLFGTLHPNAERIYDEKTM